MAATIARARGFRKDGTPQAGEASRLGSGSAHTIAATWRTAVTATVLADGSGWITLDRDGKRLHDFYFEPEGAQYEDEERTV